MFNKCFSIFLNVKWRGKRKHFEHELFREERWQRMNHHCHFQLSIANLIMDSRARLLISFPSDTRALRSNLDDRAREKEKGNRERLNHDFDTNDRETRGLFATWPSRITFDRKPINGKLSRLNQNDLHPFVEINSTKRFLVNYLARAALHSARQLENCEL